MQYKLEFRVFRSDEGWRYGILFTSVSVSKPMLLPAEQIGQYTYETEERATTAGLRALSVAISKMRKTSPVKVMR